MPAPEIIAHRGTRDRYPENSLPAFEAALADGADAIELDVHRTRDGVVVVHHDHALPRVPGSLLAGRPIGGVDYEQLSKFELAPGVQIPTLEEVLQAVTGQARVYIEIKAPSIESLVSGVINRIPSRASRCAVHSFDHRIIARFHEVAPTIETGILLVGYPVDAAALLSAANATDLWQTGEFIDADLVTAVHNVGGRVIAWTSNDPMEWTQLSQLGVDGICTDRTASLRAALRN